MFNHTRIHQAAGYFIAGSVTTLIGTALMSSPALKAQSPTAQRHSGLQQIERLQRALASSSRQLTSEQRLSRGLQQELRDSYQQIMELNHQVRDLRAAAVKPTLHPAATTVLAIRPHMVTHSMLVVTNAAGVMVNPAMVNRAGTARATAGLAPSPYAPRASGTRRTLPPPNQGAGGIQFVGAARAMTAIRALPRRPARGVQARLVRPGAQLRQTPSPSDVEVAPLGIRPPVRVRSLLASTAAGRRDAGSYPADVPGLADASKRNRRTAQRRTGRRAARYRPRSWLGRSQWRRGRRARPRRTGNLFARMSRRGVFNNGAFGR